MSQTLLLPAAVAVLGAFVVIFFAKPKATHGWTEQAAQAPAESVPARAVPSE
jgi:hypothetical protein